MNPQFPLYIPSKGRAKQRITMRALESMDVPYHVVVEEQEYSQYKQHNLNGKLLVLDKAYQRDYETCDDLGETKSKGAGPARNFAWDHARANGFDWYWVMDDNITRFMRTHRNRQIECGDGAIFLAMEDFCLRYENVGMAGPNYTTFVPRLAKIPPFAANTRIYSCNLIRTDLPFPWRGRYNEDTIISLDILKAGWCTILFNAFMQEKIWTQTVKGGNTAEFYSKEGTKPKSQMLVDMHPDVARIAWRYGRCHHFVDYRPFKKTKLKKRTDVELATGINNYGMDLTVATPKQKGEK